MLDIDDPPRTAILIPKRVSDAYVDRLTLRGTGTNRMVLGSLQHARDMSFRAPVCTYE